MELGFPSNIQIKINQVLKSNKNKNSLNKKLLKKLIAFCATTFPMFVNNTTIELRLTQSLINNIMNLASPLGDTVSRIYLNFKKNQYPRRFIHQDTLKMSSTKKIKKEVPLTTRIEPRK